MNNIHSYPAVLVVGAGIAGLAVTAVLRRHGWHVDLVERAPELRTGGYKVDARGAGVEVLRRLGVLDAARARATHVRAGSVVTADGRAVAAMGGDTFGGRAGDDLEIERGDLVRLLAGVAGPIRFGVSPASLDQSGAGVRVAFTDGSEGSYDVVLGADGLHSRVRDLAGLARVDPITSLGHAIAVVTLPTDMGLSHEETTFVTAGRTALLYATATQPRARAMLLFAHEGPLPRGRADQVALLRARYADAGWRLPDVLAALDTADDVYLDAIAQVRLDRWSVDRVGLIGDAAACASPASGQGTTLALVSAWVAAAELTATPGAAAAALTRAEASLRPFAERNQALGPSNLKRMVLPTERAVRGTLATLRLVNALPFSELMLGFVARSLAKASAFELPAEVSPRPRGTPAARRSAPRPGR